MGGRRKSQKRKDGDLKGVMNLIIYNVLTRAAQLDEMMCDVSMMITYCYIIDGSNV